MRILFSFPIPAELREKNKQRYTIYDCLQAHARTCVPETALMTSCAAFGFACTRGIVCQARNVTKNHLLVGCNRHILVSHYWAADLGSKQQRGNSRRVEWATFLLRHCDNDIRMNASRAQSGCVDSVHLSLNPNMLNPPYT